MNPLTVNAGDVFIPSASLHNDAVRLINSLPFSGAAAIGSSIVRTVSVMLHGDNNTALSSGMAVGFKLDVEYSVEATSEHTAAPAIYYVEPYDPGKHTAFGVLTTPLSKGVTGSAVISGEVVILLDDAAGSGVAALPQSGGTWRFSGSGYGILAKLSNKAVINLTGDAFGTYNSYFTVRLFYTADGFAQVLVADGATYDNTTQSSDDMPFFVNNKKYTIASTLLDVPIYRPGSEVAVILQYDPASEDKAEQSRITFLWPEQEAIYVYRCCEKLAKISVGADNSYSVQQLFTGGVPRLKWLRHCNSNTYPWLMPGTPDDFSANSNLTPPSVPPSSVPPSSVPPSSVPPSSYDSLITAVIRSYKLVATIGSREYSTESYDDANMDESGKIYAAKVEYNPGGPNTQVKYYDEIGSWSTNTGEELAVTHNERVRQVVSSVNVDLLEFYWGNKFPPSSGKNWFRKWMAVGEKSVVLQKGSTFTLTNTLHISWYDTWGAASCGSANTIELTCQTVEFIKPSDGSRVSQVILFASDSLQEELYYFGKEDMINETGPGDESFAQRTCRSFEDPDTGEYELSLVPEHLDEQGSFVVSYEYRGARK